jgi:hypothetical protein
MALLKLTLIVIAFSVGSGDDHSDEYQRTFVHGETRALNHGDPTCTHCCKAVSDGLYESWHDCNNAGTATIIAGAAVGGSSVTVGLDFYLDKGMEKGMKTILETIQEKVMNKIQQKAMDKVEMQAIKGDLEKMWKRTRLAQVVMTIMTVGGFVVAIAGIATSADVLPIIALLFSSGSLLLRIFRVKKGRAKADKMANLMAKIDLISNGGSSEGLQEAMAALAASAAKPAKKAQKKDAASEGKKDGPIASV